MLLLAIGILIMILSLFSPAAALLPGLGFGAILCVAGISLHFGNGRPSRSETGRSVQANSSSRSQESGYRPVDDSRQEMIDAITMLDGRRGRKGSRFKQFDILVAPVSYQGFDILITHTPEEGYRAEIRDGSNVLQATGAGFDTTEEALAGAKEYIERRDQE